MKRFLLGLAAGAVAFVMLSPDALAHGGQFRGPGGAVPPGLREPTDPTPPPPPPPTTQPPVTTPSDPAAPPPPTTPSSPAPPPPTTMPDLPGVGPKRPSTPSWDQWVFWWNNNNDDILGLKAAIYGLRGTVESGLGVLGGAGSGSKTATTRPTEKQVKDVLIPALLWAMDHKNGLHPDIESAAYIALAKVTDDPSHFKKIMEGVYKKDGQPNKDVDQIVRESAALALGLIRRADRPFEPKEIDKVREFLFTVVEDENGTIGSGNTRPFAALAIGMLGDQPTNQGTTGSGGGGLFYAPDTAANLNTTSGRLWSLIHKEWKNDDMPVCLLLALSLQKPNTVTTEMVTELRDCALRGKLGKVEVKDLIASYAALAVGRLGGRDDIGPMGNVFASHVAGTNTKRSTAIALGQLGKRVDGQDRADVAKVLWKAFQDAKEDSTKNFALISLAYVLMADVAAERTDVLTGAKVKLTDELLNIARDGNYRQRPFAALACGLVAQKIGEKTEIPEYAAFRGKAVGALMEGVEDLKLDKRGRAAFAIGLGLLKETAAIKKLLPLVTNRDEDKELRGYAAVALGMIGDPRPDVVKGLMEALKEHSSEELRQQTAIGLGLLHVPNTIPFLLKELDEAENQNVAGQIVLALAKIGDADTIKPLVEILKPESGKTPKPDITRALACAGLGLIGDLEMVPSLSRLSKDINYRASTPSLSEVLTIL